MNTKEINFLNKEEVIAYPTDTVFGLLAKLNKENIWKINCLKGRDKNQPIQVMFSSIEEALIKLELDEFSIKFLKENINPRTSYLVKIKKEFQDRYLTEEFKETILLRIPDKDVINLIESVGPLLATSANRHNEEPMMDNKEINKEFNIYVSEKKQKNNKDSKIISLLNNEVKVLRE